MVAYVADEEALDDSVDFVAEYPHIPLVAVIPDLDLASFARAVRAGASGVVDDADSLDSLREVISSTLQDRVSAPVHIVRAMAQRIPPPLEIGATLDEDEIGWLRGLAAGETVGGLSERIGYSERETYRMLCDLYRCLGVTNRTEAIIWATRHGLLDPEHG